MLLLRQHWRKVQKCSIISVKVEAQELQRCHCSGLLKCWRSGASKLRTFEFVVASEAAGAAPSDMQGSSVDVLVPCLLA